jgi:tripartite-type tricarboxylate transporter receptor subunit TctC
MDKLNKAVIEALAMPEVKERLAKIGAEATPTTPTAFDELVVRELKENAELVKAAGIKPQ